MVTGGPWIFECISDVCPRGLTSCSSERNPVVRREGILSNYFVNITTFCVRFPWKVTYSDTGSIGPQCFLLPPDVCVCVREGSSSLMMTRHDINLSKLMIQIITLPVSIMCQAADQSKLQQLKNLWCVVNGHALPCIKFSFISVYEYHVWGTVTTPWQDITASNSVNYVWDQISYHSSHRAQIY
jgi:hypothetical protein